MTPANSPLPSLPTPAYRRILLKISGEALMGDGEYGISPAVINRVADEVKELIDLGVQVGMVIGGGNICRGAGLSAAGMDRVTGDHMGMLATVLNALAMQDALEQKNVYTRVMSAIKINQICEDYIRRRAVRHLEKGRVVIVAGGTARPYVTHDTAAVSFALELDCELVLKASKVEGVYDKDPAQFSDAVKLDQVSFQEAVEDNAIKVMDKAAMGLAMEQNKPVVVFDIMTDDNFLKVIKGEPIGTRIS